MLEQEPIHSLSMEMSTLGSMMLGDTAMAKMIAAILEPEMFYRPAHQEIFRVMLGILDKSLPLEIEFVVEQLGKKLDEVGNESYIIQIAEYVPSASSGPYYAKSVRDAWAKRTIRKIGESVTEESELDEVLIEIDGVSKKAVSSRAHATLSTMGTLDPMQVSGLPSGWSELDALFSCRGFPIGQYVLVRARTGVGKTPFLTQACIESASMGQKCLYMTFADLSSHELQERMMKYLTGWSKTPTQSLELSANWADKKKYLAGLGIDVYDGTCLESGVTIQTVVAWLEANHRERGWDKVFIDYLQEIGSRGARDKKERLDVVSREIKAVTKRLQVSTVLAGQVSNSAQEGDMTNGGREADERAASIFDIKPNPDNGSGEIKIVKNRFGDQTTLQYTFDKKHLRFAIHQ